MTQHTPILEHFLWRDPSFKKLEVFRMSQVPGYFLPFILVWKRVNWQELGRDWTNREVRVPIELESLPSHICFFLPWLHTHRELQESPAPSHPAPSRVRQAGLQMSLTHKPHHQSCLETFDVMKSGAFAIQFFLQVWGLKRYLRVTAVRGIYQPSWSVLMWSIRSQESPKALL